MAGNELPETVAMARKLSRGATGCYGWKIMSFQRRHEVPQVDMAGERVSRGPMRCYRLLLAENEFLEAL